MRRQFASILLFLSAAGVALETSAQVDTGAAMAGSTAGPIRLIQAPRKLPDALEKGQKSRAALHEGESIRETTEKVTREQGKLVRPPPLPSEFELFVSRLASQGKRIAGNGDDELPLLVRRYGLDLSKVSDDTLSDEGPALVPDDYLIGPGDEILLTIWGGVEASLQLRVERNGLVSIPRVGGIQVVGVRFADLKEVISRRVARQFKHFELSVALGELKAVRVYVTGHVQRPGSYLVSSLSTTMQAVLAAGGPTAVGSVRDIQLRRGSALVGRLDLYKFLLGGDRTGDSQLRAGDVVHVAAVGPQVGVIGSVNFPAIFELLPGDTAADVLTMAGGLSSVANRGSASLYSFDERRGQELRAITFAESQAFKLRDGDVLRVSSAADLERPSQAMGRRVRVDGEVARPGDYVLPAGSTLADAISAAGGATTGAFLFGTEFTRESVRLSQVENYNRALLQLETEFTRGQVIRKERAVPPASETQVNRQSDQLRLLERLRGLRPTGRIVLQLDPDARELPRLLVEDQDRVYVPPRPSAVGVYGSVFNGGSYLYAQNTSLGDYVAQAGGSMRGADTDSTFVVRANGSVVSERQRGKSGWLMRDGVAGRSALPGDTIFIPEDMQRVALSQELKDWAQIISQFGLGAVALKSLK